MPSPDSGLSLSPSPFASADQLAARYNPPLPHIHAARSHDSLERGWNQNISAHVLPGAQPVNLRRVQSQENQFLPCFLDVCRVNLMIGFHSFEFFAAGRTDSNQLLRALQFLV